VSDGKLGEAGVFGCVSRERLSVEGVREEGVVMEEGMLDEGFDNDCDGPGSGLLICWSRLECLRLARSIGGRGILLGILRGAQGTGFGGEGVRWVVLTVGGEGRKTDKLEGKTGCDLIVVLGLKTHELVSYDQ
jgi:hypothetical protein